MVSSFSLRLFVCYSSKLENISVFSIQVFIVSVCGVFWLCWIMWLCGMLCNCRMGGKVNLISSSRLVVMFCSVGVQLGGGKVVGRKLFSYCSSVKWVVKLISMLMKLVVSLMSMNLVRQSVVICVCVMLKQCSMVQVFRWCSMKWCVVMVMVSVVSMVDSSLISDRNCLVWFSVVCIFGWLFFSDFRCMLCSLLVLIWCLICCWQCCMVLGGLVINR